MVFNTVINTLILQMKLAAMSIGDTFSRLSLTVNALLFTDDVTLIAKFSKVLRKLCNIVSTWCDRSNLFIKSSKCKCMSFSFKPSFHLRDPDLTVCGMSIPYLGDEDLGFWGCPSMVSQVTASLAPSQLVLLLTQVDLFQE